MRTFVFVFLLPLVATSRLWPPPNSLVKSGEVVSIAPSFCVVVSGSSSVLETAAKRYTKIIHSTTPAPPPKPQCDWQAETLQCKSDADCSAWTTKNCHAGSVQSYCRNNGFCHFSGSTVSSASALVSDSTSARPFSSLLIWTRCRLMNPRESASRNGSRNSGG